MNAGIFGEGFPYSNFHDLNMDWIIKIAKDFLDQYTNLQQMIADGETSLQNLTTEGLQQLQDKADNLEELLQDWYDTHSSDIAEQLADALQDLNTWYTEHTNYLNQILLDKIAEFNIAANEKTAESIDSIPDDYSQLASDVQTISGYTRNIITGKISNRSINNSGLITSGGGGTGFDLFYAPCVQGTTYAISSDENEIVLGFFENEPADASVTYDAHRTILENTYIITAPITGYIAIRTTTEYRYAQIEEGYFKTLYVPYITANDYIARAGLQNKEYYIHPTFTDGYYVNKNNVITEDTTNNWSLAEDIDIKPYHHIVIPWYITGSGASIVLLSEDKQTIIAAYNAADLGDNFPLIMTPPTNACWLRASCRTTHKDDFTVYARFNYIGSTKKLVGSNPDASNPIGNIIRDGGFTRIFEKIGVVGDSLSSGAVTPDPDMPDAPDDTDMIYYSWLQYLARATGQTGFNFSFSGMSAHSFRWSTSNVNVQRVRADLANTDKKCKAYYIALGHNDRNYANAHPEYVIGTIADCDRNAPDNNPDTFYGNYGWIISLLKQTQPHCKIFLITMKSRSAFSEYNSAIREIANYYNTLYDKNVYLIDMEGVPLETSWEYTNGHGNTMGYLNYSYQIGTYTNWIIEHNKDEFKYVQFIGTGFMP